MASKFVLDTGQLDTDYLTTPPTLILDFSLRGKLDTNVLSSGTPIVVNDVATSVLGGLSATVQSTPQVIVSGASQLGAISSIAQANVIHSVQGSSNLGSLNATANTIPVVLPSFTANLGSMESTANTIVTKVVQAQSLLGSLTATIEALPKVDVSGNADLGSLTATAQASTPTPPEPDKKYGSQNGYYQVKNEKKPEPVEIKPTIINYEFEPLKPLIKTIFATSQTDLFGLNTMAQSRIDFSTEQDDLDLLMIL
jgi:hypothetical protein